MLLRRLALIGAAALLVAAPAAAHGDLASIALETTRVFLPPFGGQADDAHARALNEALDRASAKGYEVKVALIASPADLGERDDLFGRPQAYASFLGRDLLFRFRGRVLTVMPQGVGLVRGGRASSEARLVRTISVGTGANGLTDAAIAAVSKLARVPRSKLVTSSSSKAGSFDWTLVPIAAGGAAVLIAMMVLGPAAVRRRRTAS